MSDSSVEAVFVEESMVHTVFIIHLHTDGKRQYTILIHTRPFTCARTHTHTHMHRVCAQLLRHYTVALSGQSQ